MVTIKGEKDDLITQMLQEYNSAISAESDIRTEGLEDVKIAVGDQWGDVRADRINDGRPCLTINKTQQFVKTITNEMRKTRPAPKAVAVGDSSKELASIFTGIMKYIHTSSQGDVAIDTATDGQVTNGWGYLRVTTEYCDDESFNQDIKTKRIKNPFSVVFDPNALEPDYSDAKYAFVIEDKSRAEFEKLYPNAEVASGFKDAVGSSQNSEINGTDTVRIAEYWKVEEKKKKIYLYDTPNGPHITDKEVEGVKADRERVVFERKVKCYITNGVEILDEKDWAGKWIPIVPFLGRDVDVDGKRYLYGLVRPMRDAQRMYNFWNSAATEVIALAPRSPFIVAEGQVKGYEDVWEKANKKNFSYLPYVPVTFGGKQAPMPHRNSVEQPIQAISFAINQASEDMKATTGIYNASLGQTSNETSGKGILARQQQGALANYDFVDNSNRSIRHYGRILMDLIPKIIDAPRVIKILGEDGVEKEVMVNQEFIDQQDGLRKLYDLSSGRYEVVAEVGAGSPTKRQEEREELAFVMQTNPDLMQIAGDLYFDLFDAPYAKEIAKRIRGEDKDKAIPPQAKQALDQAHQMIEQLTKELNKLQDESDAKKLELESKEKIAAENNQTKIIIEEMKNNFGAFSEELKHLQAHLKVKMQPVDSNENYDTMGGINAVEQ